MAELEENLEVYKKAVEEDARKGTDFLYHNKGNEHALIICTNIFKNANHEIRIAANQLYNDEVVNTLEYIESMRTFLDKDGTMLKILIAQAPPKESVKRDGTLYGMIYEHPAYAKGRVQIRHGYGKSFTGMDKNPVNFCTADDKMYRFENDIISRKAIANFGDQERAIEFREIFDSVYNSTKETETVNLHNYFG